MCNIPGTEAGRQPGGVAAECPPCCCPAAIAAQWRPPPHHPCNPRLPSDRHPRLSARAARPVVLPPSTTTQLSLSTPAPNLQQSPGCPPEAKKQLQPLSSQNPENKPWQPLTTPPLPLKPTQHPLPLACSQRLQAPNPQPVASKPSQLPHRQVPGFRAFPDPSPAPETLPLTAHSLKGRRSVRKFSTARTAPLAGSMESLTLTETLNELGRAESAAALVY